MDHYKKERSSRQHLRIDLESSLSQDEGGGLLLSNPMACTPGIITPTSCTLAPAAIHNVHNTNNGIMASSSSTAAASHPHSSHHHPSSSSSSLQRTSPPSAFAANSLTQSLNYSTHTPHGGGGGGGLSFTGLGPGNSGSLTRGISGGGSSERSSFGKGGKNRSKSPALLRFFVRGSAGSRKTSEVEEEDYGSSGSDHEDPFSPRSVTGVVGENSRHTSSDPLKSPSTSVEQYATLPRQFRRYHSTGSTYIVTQRDSGFSSERESISHMKDDPGMTQIIEDCHGSPTLVEDYHPAGMEALEVLHNQLQILVKQECDNEETDVANVYEQVIASLSKQIEELSLSMDSLRQSDQNLSLSLRMAEQRAMEAETKLRHALDRNQRSEQKYLKLAIKYQALAKKHREMEKVHQRKLTHRTSKDWSSPRLPPQRVHSHNQYDRENSASLDAKRPSTAQGFHSDSSSSSQQQQQPTTSKTTVVSLSHTQTSV